MTNFECLRFSTTKKRQLSKLSEMIFSRIRDRGKLEIHYPVHSSSILRFRCVQNVYYAKKYQILLNFYIKQKQKSSISCSVENY